MSHADFVQIATINDNDVPIYGPDDPDYLAEALAILRARLAGLDVQTVRINRAVSLAYVNGPPEFDPDGRIVDLAPVR